MRTIYKEDTGCFPAKNRSDRLHRSVSSPRRWWRVGWMLVALGCLGVPSALLAQAPVVLWTTNLNARLFAVDEQTNVYANAGGTVIKLSGLGVPLQTNTICPLPGLAQRDAAGNFYFAGTFDGTQDFGGITLVGGLTNGYAHAIPQWWAPGYPTCFLAKYSSNGALQWVQSFGEQLRANKLTDVVVNDDGTVVVAFGTSAGLASDGRLGCYSASGSKLWESVVPWSRQIGSELPTLKASKVSGTNGYYLVHDFNTTTMCYAGSFDTAGGVTNLGPYFTTYYVSDLCFNGKPIPGSAGNVAMACLLPPEPVAESLLISCGSVAWQRSLGTVEQWALASDSAHHIYLAGTDGGFSMYDANGTSIWSTNLGKPAVAMIVDAHDNRFLSFTNGAVARLTSEPGVLPPIILTNPPPQTVFSGDPASFTASVGGTLPRQYIWQHDGTTVSSGTNLTLNLSAASPSQAGLYTLVVTNAAGSVTSAPALLRVKTVQFYLGSQMLTNGSYSFSAPPTLTIRSAFTNGATYYTLDGTAPSFASTLYTKPFLLTNSATVRALGYSADFMQSEEADPIVATVPPQRTLSVSTAGGGSISLSPPGGTYPSASTVTITALPDAGWSFLYWTGDAWGANPSFHVTMDSDKSIQAVFGTALSTTVAGHGRVAANPLATLYPYGSVVRLTAVPEAGSYFGAWGNAASGNTNPLDFTVTNANRTVSSVFGTIPAGQATLVALADGPGQVNLSPRANLYPINQSITLTAVPDLGQVFVGWSGDASGTQNPLTINLTQSKIITAVFTRWPILAARGLAPEGFHFTLTSGPGLAYQVLVSSNLANWQPLSTLTNLTGQTPFTDPKANESPRRFYKAVPQP